MFEGNMFAFFKWLIVLFLAKVEPVQSSVEDAVWQTAPALIEEISDWIDVVGYGMGGLQHLGESSREVVTVEVKEVIASSWITYLLA